MLLCETKRRGQVPDDVVPGAEGEKIARGSDRPIQRHPWDRLFRIHCLSLQQHFIVASMASGNNKSNARWTLRLRACVTIPPVAVNHPQKNREPSLFPSALLC